MKLKIMTQNVRCGNDPNGHSIKERTPRLLAQIQEWDPDLLGFQEATPEWEMRLEPLKERYGVIWMYRHPCDSREATPIYWKKDVFELVEEEHFWLSETPMAVSKGWNSDHFRVASRAGLRHKESGKILQLFNTHFDWVAPGPRESAQLIIRKAEKLGDVPVFAIADFNFTPDSPPWHSMRSWFYDVREEIAPENTQSTTCSYRPAGSPGGHIIDYCFYHGNGVKPTRYEVLTKEYDGKFVSDHFGVYFEFEVEE